jgi:hypothetical protein
MYLALGVGILIAFTALIVVVVAVLAGHAEPRDELDTELRARLASYVR